MTTPALETYNGTEYQLALPTHWERHVDQPGPPVALLALEPDAEDDVFRANVVLTIENIDDGERWQETAGAALSEHLREYLLLDEERLPIADDDTVESGVRRLFHHHIPGSGAITGEQWAWVAGDRGFTLTASTATFDYDDKADLFAAIADRFRSQRKPS